MPRERLNVLIHGEPKTGKTTFSVRKNPGVVIADTEGSSKLIKGVRRVEIKSMTDMDNILDLVKNGSVKVVVIDTLDELVNNFGKQEVRRKGGDFVQKDGTISMKGWGFLRERFLGMTRSFRDAGADVLTICHSELLELPEGGKKWTMKLPSDYAREVMGMCDVVAFIQVVRTEDGNKHRTHFVKTPMWDAGTRAIYDAATDKFTSALPETIDDAAFVDVLTAYDKFFAEETTPTVTDKK